MFFKKKKKLTQEWVNQKIGHLYFSLKNEMEKTRSPFFPSRDFYNEWSDNDFSLAVMAQKILFYLDEPVGNFIVAFHNGLGDTPGVFTVTEEGQEVIFVNDKYIQDPYAVGAVLAHEIMHLYLMSRKHIVLEDANENELLTDLGTIYLGLGILVINGMSYKSNWFLTVMGLFAGLLYVNEQKLAFGYFDPHQYAFYLKEYFKRNNIKLREVAKRIHPKSWHFIGGLPFRVRLSKESIFSREARRKVIFNTIGIFIVLVIGGFFIYSWTTPDDFNNSYQSNYGAITAVSKELDNKITKLSTEINKLEATIKSQEQQLEELSKRLDRYKTINDIYNYNSLVPVYNNLISEYEATVELYNQKVNIYNQTIKNIK